ncbi:MAG: RNA polymerase sigma factor [Candidatus Omnitrophota bacterium]
MPNLIEEQTLIDALKKNEPQAFRLLLQTYKNTVANICYRFLFNREDAEELTQEVFIEIYRGISTFRGDAKLSTWIYQLAVSKSIDLIRSRKRKKRFGHVLSLFGMEDSVPDIPEPNGHGPVDELENEEKGRIIREAIDTLPVNYRRVFTLSKCEFFSNKEIAEITGMTQSAVESIVHRAGKQLRTILYSFFEKEIKKNSKNEQTDRKNNVKKNNRALNIISVLIMFNFFSI